MRMKPQNLPQDTDWQEQYARTNAAAIRLLARREHSVLELRRKLLLRGFEEAAIEAVFIDLIDQNLLSERRFTDEYVRMRFERGYGPARIRAELRERGVDEQYFENLLEKLSGQWIGVASQQREKRFGQWLPDEFSERARQMRFLQQRGFTGEQIRTVFRD